MRLPLKSPWTLLLGALVVVLANPMPAQDSGVTLSNHRLGYQISIPAGYDVDEHGGMSTQDRVSEFYQNFSKKKQPGDVGNPPPSTLLRVRPDEGSPKCEVDIASNGQPREINGITFYRYHVREAGAGQRWNEVWYSTNRDGLCFSLEIITEKGFQEPKDYESIVSSFRFISKY